MKKSDAATMRKRPNGSEEKMMFHLAADSVPSSKVEHHQARLMERSKRENHLNR
jgi:hypothetical protein